MTKSDFGIINVHRKQLRFFVEMIVKPYGKKSGLDLWFRIKQPRIGDVDMADRWFGVMGEFNPYADAGFERHIKRLNGLAHNPFFYKYNGQRIKMILQQERLWY